MSVTQCEQLVPRPPQRSFAAMTSKYSRSVPSPSERTRRFVDAPHSMLIGGEWIAGDGREIEVENPATATVIATVHSASVDQLDQAVSAARNAIGGIWGRMNGRDRGAVLMRMATLIERDSDLMAEVMTLDNGSPLSSSKMVIQHLAAELFRYYAGWATKIEGQSFTPSIGARPDQEFLVATLREPIGVVGAIVPWNAPAGMIALKMAPALAAGCALVLKTAELAPLTGELFARLWTEAGGPPGSFNLVHGYGADIGATMAAHPGIDKIAFTGSTEVGRQIVKAAVGNLKKVSLELGGKSPVIIFPDADLEAAIPAAAMACYLSSGQQCMAGSRLFIHSKIHDRVAAGIADYARSLRLGEGFDPATILGPLISARHKSRVLDYIALAKAEGATTLLDSVPVGGPGHFVAPALFSNVVPGMRIEQEEIFGPVLCIIRFDEEDELIAAVNGTPYGLSGSVWTRDIQRAFRIAKRVDSGQVAINAHAAMSPETPFGGNRQSGWGREFGREGLDGYLKTKAVSVNLGRAS